MGNFLMNRDRPQERASLTSGEESVPFWRCLRAVMVWVFELRWSLTPTAYELLMLHPFLLE